MEQLFREALVARGFARSDHGVPESAKRFPDGAQCRVEIPSTEGPDVLDAVLAEADARGVPVHRVSQGSGALLLTDAELERMAATAARRPVELSLFARPLTGWGAASAASHTPGGAALGAQARGTEQLVHVLEDIARAVDAGVRSVLVTDLGVLETAASLRAAGEFPADLQFKISVQMGLSNPAAIRLAERLGADTYNVPTDMTLGELAAVRAAVDIPLDVYIESPNDLGGFVRHAEIADIVRVAAPVYLKFGLANTPVIYPSGTHLDQVTTALGRERVRRAQIGLERLHRTMPDAVMSAIPATGLALPSL
ncbi:U32 family peptidase [Pseudonocardia xinjiangensis]|uniref:U32 family peptidase n=1 Tax=Pseudonocardia xinjiangensis TaxID=75289 RepID=UPI00337786F9